MEVGKYYRLPNDDLVYITKKTKSSRVKGHIIVAIPSSDPDKIDYSTLIWDQPILIIHSDDDDSYVDDQGHKVTFIEVV